MTYRLLNEGEKILPTDEFYRTNDNTEVTGNGKWVAIGEMEDEYKEWYLPVRRVIEQPQIVESEPCEKCRAILIIGNIYYCDHCGRKLR